MSRLKGSQPKAAFLAAHLSAHDARIAKQATALREIGWGVDFLAWQNEHGPYPTLPDAKLLAWANHNVSRFDTYLPGPIHHLRRAARQRNVMQSALIAGHYDVVICSDPETLRPAARAKSRGGFKLVYDAHEFYPDEVPNDTARARWVKRVHREAGPSIDAFITVNDAIAVLYSQQAPELTAATVICNASPLRNQPPYDGRLHALADITRDIPILLFQGGFARDRGLEALVLAMESAQSDWVAVFMGSGSLEPRLKTLGGSRVRFVPPQTWNDLHFWTAGASLGAVLYEGTCANQRLCSPNKLWEYPAAGVPLLASNLPFLGKVVRDNEIGLLVDEPITSQSIQEALRKATPDVLKQLQSKTRTFTQANNWESQAQRFVALMTHVAGRSQKET